MTDVWIAAWFHVEHGTRPSFSMRTGVWSRGRRLVILVARWGGRPCAGRWSQPSYWFLECHATRCIDDLMVLCRTATPTKQHLECQATRCTDDLMVLYRTATGQSMVGGPISRCQHSTNIPMDRVHPRGPITRCRCVLVWLSQINFFFLFKTLDKIDNWYDKIEQKTWMKH